MKALIFISATLAVTSTAAVARCPTLTGYLAFKRCYLEAGGLLDGDKLELQFEIMLAEDLAKIRTTQYRRQLDPLKPARPSSQLPATRKDLDKSHRTPLSHRNIEAEIQLRQSQRQQNSFETGRARNTRRVEQGRIRSQDLLYGTQNR